MNHADIYCKTIDALTLNECVNALHQSLMQFQAVERGTEAVDNAPTITEIQRLLTKAGHIGFTP